VLAVVGRVAPEVGATPPVSRLSVEAVGLSVEAVVLPVASALSASDPKLAPASLGTVLASAPVAGAAALVGSLVWACASALAKSVDDPVSAVCVEPVLEPELLSPLMPSSLSSSDPLDNDWSCCSIAEIRVRASEMLPILIRGSVQ
jgi:hypothetical protein